MRRYPPVPGSMPRVVPKGGAHVAGHFVPQGTVVSVAQYPMFHSSRNISDPFSFKPERFIEPDKFPGDRIDAVQAFSVGPRDCIGKKSVTPSRPPFPFSLFPFPPLFLFLLTFFLSFSSCRWNSALCGVKKTVVDGYHNYSLAYAEMRTILARILFNFDLELVEPQKNWLDHNAYFLWSKPALDVYLTPVR